MFYIPKELEGKNISTGFYRLTRGAVNKQHGIVAKRYYATFDSRGGMTVRREFRCEKTKRVNYPGWLTDLFADKADRDLTVAQAVRRLREHDARQRGHGFHVALAPAFRLADNDVPLEDAAAICRAYGLRIDIA